MEIRKRSRSVTGKDSNPKLLCQYLNQEVYRSNELDNLYPQGSTRKVCTVATRVWAAEGELRRFAFA
jgi:hypothetical protein